MALFKNKYRIESNRLKNWDYSSNATYFLTICSYQRECLYGTIENKEMILNENGKIIEQEILNSIIIRQNWIFHNWKIMPNHVHFLIEINNPIISRYSHSRKTIHPLEIDNGDLSNLETRDVETHNVETHSSASLQQNNPQNVDAKNQLIRKPKSISSFMGGLKATITLKINAITKKNEGSVWQSNFHDHIVRNQEEFQKIFYYIENNPKKWDEDTFNPKNDKKQ
jgi:putative transposase